MNLALFCSLFSMPLVAQSELTPRERMLLDRIEKLEQRLAVLEARATPSTPVPAVAELQPQAAAPVPAGTTINASLDGYFGYNFNKPANGVNQLRAYDVSGRGFNFNQVGLIVERAPDAAAGRRLGGRVDLMFGQATDTLQGSASNEPRPQIFRHLFQAYGTYVAPLFGRDVTVDFGKWASSIGMEGNYTKDQFNYSRSSWFNFLPFYHMGVRANVPVTSTLTAGYWLVNGANQTEDFNGFRSQALALSGTPNKKLSWTFNYYTGREAIGNPGRTHILDGYFNWQPTQKLTFAAEGDYVIARALPGAPPKTVSGGAGYARYQFHPKFQLAGRFGYMKDEGGLYSGVPQTLRDTTITATFDVAQGMQMRWEFRRDASNVPFFHASNDERRRQQSTALLGLIWWFGGKSGSW